VPSVGAGKEIKSEYIVIVMMGVGVEICEWGVGSLRQVLQEVDWHMVCSEGWYVMCCCEVDLVWSGRV